MNLAVRFFLQEYSYAFGVVAAFLHSVLWSVLCCYPVSYFGVAVDKQRWLPSAVMFWCETLCSAYLLILAFRKSDRRSSTFVAACGIFLPRCATVVMWRRCFEPCLYLCPLAAYFAVVQKYVQRRPQTALDRRVVCYSCLIISIIIPLVAILKGTIVTTNIVAPIDVAGAIIFLTSSAFPFLIHGIQCIVSLDDTVYNTVQHIHPLDPSFVDTPISLAGKAWPPPDIESPTKPPESSRGRRTSDRSARRSSAVTSMTQQSSLTFPHNNESTILLRAEQPHQFQPLHKLETREAFRDREKKVESDPLSARSSNDSGLSVDSSSGMNSARLKTAVPLKYRVATRLGRGAYAEVFLGMNTSSGQLIAVKRFINAKMVDQRIPESMEREINILRPLTHPNIVQYLGTDRAQGAFSVLLEYVPGGSIHSLLEQFGPFSEAVIRVYTRQILEGLGYLHAKGIVHGDIKAQNLLVSENGTVKLSDFGLSRARETASCQVSSGPSESMRSDSSDSMHIGTPCWSAPEALRGNLDTPSDIWSLGCTLIEMCTGKEPWSERNFPNDIISMHFICNTTETPQTPPNCSSAFTSFLDACFRTDPRQRKTVNELKEHPFLTDCVKDTGHLHSSLYIEDTKDRNRAALHRKSSASSMASSVASFLTNGGYNSIGSFAVNHVTAAQDAAQMYMHKSFISKNVATTFAQNAAALTATNLSNIEEAPVFSPRIDTQKQDDFSMTTELEKLEADSVSNPVQNPRAQGRRGNTRPLQRMLSTVSSGRVEKKWEDSSFLDDKDTQHLTTPSKPKEEEMDDNGNGTRRRRMQSRVNESPEMSELVEMLAQAALTSPRIK